MVRPWFFGLSELESDCRACGMRPLGKRIRTGEGCIMDDNQAIRQYAKEINGNLQSGATEHTHRPAIKDLLDHVAGNRYAFNEASTNDPGNPDFVIKIGATDAGFVECKNVLVNLSAIESDSESINPVTENGKQLKRYRSSYQNLLFTNCHEIRWFRNGSRRGGVERLLQWDGGVQISSPTKRISFGNDFDPRFFEGRSLKSSITPETLQSVLRVWLDSCGMRF